MKKIFAIMLLLLAAETYSQYSLTVYLQSSGVPVTGKAGVMVFTRYPHSYGTDNVSGLTISEIGSTGSYVAKGFTTYEYVKLWVDGVAQSWFDSVQVGDITAYITTRLGSYVTIGTTQTVTGTKTFGNGNISGDWLQSLGTFTLYGPKINTSATIYSAYGSVNADHMIWRGFGDSNYVPKSWMFLNSTKITLQSGYKIWGLGNTTPIAYNTDHFGWNTSTGLYLSNPPDYNYDSLTVRVDTTISENPYYKYWTARRGLFNQRDSMDLYWYYKNTYANTSDSFAVINKVYTVDNSSTITLTSADQRLDSLYLGPGTYSIDFGVNYTFVSASLGSVAATSDSIIIGLNKGTGVGNILKNNIFAARHYVADVNGPVMGVLEWKAVVKLTADTWVYVVAKRMNVLNDFGHIINRQYILATRIN